MFGAALCGTQLCTAAAESPFDQESTLIVYGVDCKRLPGVRPAKRQIGTSGTCSMDALHCRIPSMVSVG
jgi:hypothetical protein